MKLNSLTDSLDDVPHAFTTGKIKSIRGAFLSASLPEAALGDLCYIERRAKQPLPAQVIAFNGDLVSLALFDNPDGLHANAGIWNSGGTVHIGVGTHLIGSIVDAFAMPLGSSELVRGEAHRLPVELSAPGCLNRVPISEVLATGIRTIDGLHPIGYGQRLGLFASAGVGKSTLLGTIARNADVDLAVIALVGERGREVQEFIHDCLTAQGQARSIVVVSTSDESPYRRYLAALSATTIAQYFATLGKRVLLLVDSVTRIARALRDISLSFGEVPVRQGYTPRVYTELPRLFERTGRTGRGSVTALYTVLTNGDDESDPLAEEVKSLLDGHLYLDASLALRGIRPAINPLKSISRLRSRLLSEAQEHTAVTVLRLMHRLESDREMLLFGATPDAELKAALECENELYMLLSQGRAERCEIRDTLAGFEQLAARFEALQRRP